MKEINRFSLKSIRDNSVVRVIVLQDEEGFFHINQEIISDLSGQDRKGRVCEDIHGKMTTEAYNAWLCNALFNMCFTTVHDITEKQWLMHD